MKKISRKHLETPPATLQPSQGDNLSAYLKRFEGKTPRQFVEEMFPNGNPEAIMGHLSGLGLDFGVPIPQWAKAASNQFWQYYFRKKKPLDVTNSIEDKGAMASFMEDVIKEVSAKEPVPHPVDAMIRNIGSEMISAMEKDAREKNRQDTANFYIGRIRGGEAYENIKNPEYLKMLKRAPIYLSLCMCWQEFQKFESKAEAERWLRKHKIISQDVNSREVMAVFSIVHFNPRGRPGRPKNPKT